MGFNGVNPPVISHIAIENHHVQENPVAIGETAQTPAQVLEVDLRHLFSFPQTMGPEILPKDVCWTPQTQNLVSDLALALVVVLLKNLQAQVPMPPWLT